MAQIGSPEVVDDAPSAGLLWWSQRGQDFGLGLGRLQHHEALPACAGAMARAMLDLMRSEPLLDYVFKDAGRYFMAAVAFHLHETGGLTQQRLKAFCAGSILISPGRARTLLHVMAHQGLLAAQDGPGRRYLFTERFMTAWLAHLQAAVSAALLFEPGLAPLATADTKAPEGEALVRAFGRVHAGWLLETSTGAVGGEELMPLLTVFMHAHAGSPLLWILLGLSTASAFPPQEAGPVTLHGLSQRLGVSRVHLRRVFQAAAASGLAEVDGRGMVIFSPAAQAQLRFLYAMQFIQILRSAAILLIPANGET